MKQKPQALAPPSIVETSERRRAYERPSITFREPLEGVASVCGPPNGKSTGLCLVVSS